MSNLAKAIVDRDWDRASQFLDEINDVDENDLLTPLHRICKEPSTPFYFVKTILEANPKASYELDIHGRTALHYSCYCCTKIKVLEFIFQFNPKAAIHKDNDGNYPIDIIIPSLIWFKNQENFRSQTLEPNYSVNVFKTFLQYCPQALSYEYCDDETFLYACFYLQDDEVFVAELIQARATSTISKRSSSMFSFHKAFSQLLLSWYFELKELFDFFDFVSDELDETILDFFKTQVIYTKKPKLRWIVQNIYIIVKEILKVTSCTKNEDFLLVSAIQNHHLPFFFSIFFLSCQPKAKKSCSSDDIEYFVMNSLDPKLSCRTWNSYTLFFKCFHCHEKPASFFFHKSIYCQECANIFWLAHQPTVFNAADEHSLNVLTFLFKFILDYPHIAKVAICNLNKLEGRDV